MSGKKTASAPAMGSPPPDTLEFLGRLALRHWESVVRWGKPLARTRLPVGVVGKANAGRAPAGTPQPRKQ